MKKINITLHLFALIGLFLIACNDPFAEQQVAEPTLYEQQPLQDNDFKIKVLANPLIIKGGEINNDFDFISVTPPELLNSEFKTEYEIQLSDTETFDIHKLVPATLAGNSLKVNYKALNDTLKAINPTKETHPVFARVLAYIVGGGTKVLRTTPIVSFKATSYNYPPIAVDDNVTAFMNEELTFDALSNDSDPENDPLSVVSVTQPANGKASIKGNLVAYMPNAGYVGSDEFTYTISDGSNTASATVFVTVTALRKYFEIASVKPYYIVGYVGWNNSADGLGSDLVPLGVVEGNKYDAEGNGTFVYTGYFEASKSFKLIRDVGNWDEQWGNSGGEGIDNPVHNDGGSSNFKVPKDAYYTITLNSINHELSIVETDVKPALFDNMGLVGEMTEWGGKPDIALSAYQNNNNHVWYAEYTFGSDSQCKFRYNSDWGTNWGAASDNDGDPAFSAVGIGVPGGKNLLQNAGNYVIIFNDVGPYYYFIKK